MEGKGVCNFVGGKKRRLKPGFRHRIPHRAQNVLTILKNMQCISKAKLYPLRLQEGLGFKNIVFKHL
jgi:hypothetical protein